MQSHAVRGSDVGFSGRAGDVLIDDHYQADRLARADDPCERFDAAYGYLRKVLRHADRAADERGDGCVRDVLDEARDHIAGQMVISAQQIKALLAERGYDEAADSWHARSTAGVVFVVDIEQQRDVDRDDLPSP